MFFVIAPVELPSRFLEPVGAVLGPDLCKPQLVAHVLKVAHRLVAATIGGDALAQSVNLFAYHHRTSPICVPMTNAVRMNPSPKPTNATPILSARFSKRFI